MAKAPPLTSYALPEKLPSWGVGIFESHHAPDFEMEWRRHDFLKLIYVQAGAGTLHLESESHPFEPRDLLLAPVGVPNRLVDAAGRPASLYVVCISRQLLRFDPRIEQHLTAGRQPRSVETANRVGGLFRRLLFDDSHGGDSTSIAMVATAMELLHLVIDRQPQRYAESDRPANEAPEEMINYIERLATHFYEATSINDAAVGLGMSRRQFTKEFREATGTSWLSFVHGKAIDHAARRLVETDAPIASIAFECGFEDLSTFYRRFKALRGCSPGVWRSDSAKTVSTPN
ncbi:MAG: AraC family transcriptional regulator [Planctomycetota bacterium]